MIKFVLIPRDKNRWTFDSDCQLAVYHSRYDQGKYYYNKESLHLAIENVKKKRDSYETYDAYEHDLNHFECGLSVFVLNESKN